MLKNNKQREAVQRYLSHVSPHVRNRANIILQTLDGVASDSIASAIGLSIRTVEKWQDAWAKDGLAIFPDDMPVSESKAEGSTGEEVPKPLASEPQPEGNPGKVIEPPAPVLHVDETPIAAPSIQPAIADATEQDESALQADDTVAEAARKIMLEQLQQLQEQQADVLNKDVEAVHQMRIATRRWRSMYKGFGDYMPKTYTKKLQRYVRRTARYLGRIRDLDVLLKKTRTYVEANSDVDDLQSLVKLIKKDRRKARKQMRKWLKDKDYTKFVKRAKRTLKEPKPAKAKKSKSGKAGKNRVDNLLPKLIRKRFDAVQAYDEVAGSASIEELHNLRVECKRLRYTLEAFADVLGDEMQVVVDATKALQDHLGDMNDAQIAVEKVKDYEKQVKKSERRKLKVYRKSRKDEMKHLLATFPDVWAVFNKREVQQALKDAIATL